MPRTVVKSLGPAYLTQCACFACRKAFKKDLANPRYTPKCPECEAPMVDVGRYFRAPRKADAKQWKKVEMLIQAGVYFGGTQSWELGQFPNTLTEAREFIERNRVVLATRARLRESRRARFVESLDLREAKRRAAVARRKEKTRKANKAVDPTPRNPPRNSGRLSED